MTYVPILDRNNPNYISYEIPQHKNADIWISIDTTCKIRIHGDTVKAIALLVNQLQYQYRKHDSIQTALYKVIREQQKIIEASVNFTNQVPDYFKKPENNCKWNPYWKLLKKQGYTNTTRKKPTTDPCK